MPDLTSLIGRLDTEFAGFQKKTEEFHAAAKEVPLDEIDEQQIADWFDDRIVNFVQTVAAMHQNQNYLKGHLVADPIAGVQMPRFAAKATLEADGKTYYFISDETKVEFEKQRKSAGKS